MSDEVPPSEDGPALPARRPAAAMASGEGAAAGGATGGTGLALSVGSPCPACGARLAPRVYFCVVCSRPWREVEDVLPRARPAGPTDGELIRKKAPAVWPLFWTYFAVVLGGGILTVLVAGGEHFGAGILLLDAALLVVTAGFAATYGATLKPALTRTGFATWWGWAGVAAVVPLLLVNYAYHAVIMGVTGIEDDGLDVFERAGLSRAALVWIIAVFPAISEELAFRGLTLPWLHAALGERKALILSSALFAALHFNVLSLPYLFGVGYVLGVLRTRCGSLYPPILLHFLHNLGVLEVLHR